MGAGRRFFLRLYTFFRPARAERELTREVEAHLRLLADDFERKGMTPAAARMAARRAFGGVEQTKERAREARSFLWLEDACRDVRCAFRTLRRMPGFSVVTVLTLASGIGGTTAIFTVVNSVLLEPLPFPDPHQLVSVRHTMSGVASQDTPLSRAMYLTFREHARTLDEIALWRPSAATVTGLGQPERVQVALVTDRLFPLLGVSPILGRSYGPADGAPGSEYPVILAQGYWLRRFGGDRGVVGRSIRINGTPREIVGVMPENVREAIGGEAPQLYLPLVIDPANQRVGNWSFQGIARLRPGVAIAQAGADLTGLTELATQLYPGIPLKELEAREFGTRAVALDESLVGATGKVLWIVFGAVGILLLIACANVANLFLVKAEGQQRAVAIRTAIGASKGRLAREFLTESLVVGSLGGGMGLLLAFGGLRLFLHFAPPSIPRLEGVGVDLAALGFTLTVSMLAGLAFGLIPVFRYCRPNLNQSLQRNSRTVHPGWRLFSFQSLLAVTQIALALTLLIGSGLMIRTFRALHAVPPGFRSPEEVLTFRISVPSTEAGSGEEAARTHRAILDAVGALPGVTSVSAATSVAMESWDSWDDVLVRDFPELDAEPQPLRRLNWIAPGFFATLGNRVLAGRELEWADLDGRRDVVVVSENFAREFWKEPERALGKRIRNDEDQPWMQIVGVVENIPTKGLAQEAPSLISMPFLLSEFWGRRDFVWRNLRYVLRTARVDPAALLPEIRRVVWSVNRNLPIFEAATLDEIQAQSLSRTSFTLVMLTIAAGGALLLGIVGVYGFVAYGVARRTQEIGVRMALGARPAQVSAMVVRQGGMLAAAGVSLGLLVTQALSGLIAALLFGVQPFDPLTYGVLSSVLTAVIMLASYLPARRAAKVDPTAALRWE